MAIEEQQWGVNGVGRIGRRLLAQNEILRRRNPEKPAGVTITHLNEPERMIGEIIDALRFDAVHGGFPGEITKVGSNILSINGRQVKVSHEREPTKAWQGEGLFGVLEASGQFRERAKAAAHLDGTGIHHVLITAPSPDSDLSLVYGINDEQFTGQTIVDNASCTTKSALPVMQTMHREFGIVEADLQTVHAATGPELQRILSEVRGMAPRSWSDVDWILDEKTGAAVNVTKILPELDLRFRARAKRIRSPNNSVSLINMVVERETNPEEVAAALTDASRRYPLGVLRVIKELPTTSTLLDSNDDSVVPLSRIQGRKLVTVEAAYNNEVGPARSAIQTARLMEDIATGRKAA